jgi:thiosulfate reductase cytochrome b subunit
MVLNGQNGWGRYLHFLSAWFCILNGMLYVASGVMSRHFRQNLVPNTGPMGSRAQHEQPGTYAVPQQITYLAVVFVVLPLMIWTGLAMSPAITSVFPLIVNLLGGQQSARTMHFFAAAALGLFLFVHLVMVYITGFAAQIRAMITGRSVPAKGAA